MHAFIKHHRRTVVITGVAAIAVAGAVGMGAAAYADGTPGTATPSASATGAPLPTGATPGSPAKGAPATPPKPAPHIGGTVESVSGSTVTVKDMEGFTRTVVLGDSVTVTKAGSTTKATITTGEHIDATGSVDRNGTSLDASAVTVGMPTPPAGGPAAGGPAGHGRAKGGPVEGAPTPPTAPSAAPTAPSAAPTAPTAPASGSTATPGTGSSSATGS